MEKEYFFIIILATYAMCRQAGELFYKSLRNSKEMLYKLMEKKTIMGYINI